MKNLLVFISIMLTMNSPIASLDVSEFDNNQICMFAKDPPLPAQVIYEIESRGIECDDNGVTQMTRTFGSKESPRLKKIQRWSKIFRGKEAIFSTRSGAKLKIDTVGKEKSISIDRSF